MTSAFIVLVSCISVGNSLHLKKRESAIDFTDTSNCTWSEWSVCTLESITRCSTLRTLQLLPVANQTLVDPSNVACNGQAGRVDSSDCSDGLCPNWMIGDWSDCSSTCGSQLDPWVGYQSRNIDCVDTTGLLYRREVCGNVRGLYSVPIEEQPCNCSHTIPPFDPYAVQYTPVSY